MNTGTETPRLHARPAPNHETPTPDNHAPRSNVLAPIGEPPMIWTEANKTAFIQRTPAWFRAIEQMRATLERIDDKIGTASARGIRWNQGSLTPWQGLRSSLGSHQTEAENWQGHLFAAYREAVRAGRVQPRPDVGLGSLSLAALAIILAVVGIVVAWVSTSAISRAYTTAERMPRLQAEAAAFEAAVDQQIRLYNRQLEQREQAPIPGIPGSPAPSPPTPPPPLVLPNYPGSPQQPTDRPPTPGEQVERAAGGLAMLALAAGALFLIVKLRKG